MTNLLNIIEKNKKWHFWVFFAILIFFTLFMMQRFSTFSLVNQGNDAAFQFNRFQALVEAISNGSFPVYLDKGVEGYGYAIKYFYPDLILVPFALLASVIGTIKAYQSIFFVITVVCGYFSYLSIKNIYNDKLSAYIGSFLYTFCMYQLQDLYDRGAIGEVITFTFIPIIFWGLYEIIKGDYRKWYIITIGFSLCIFSHVLGTLLAALLVFILCILCIKQFIKEPKRLLFLVIAAVITIFVTSYFIFPYLEQSLSGSFNYEKSTLHRYFTRPTHSIIQGLFAIGTSGITYYNFIPYIGLTLTLPLIFRLFIYSKSTNLKIADAASILAVILIILSTDSTNFSLYQHIKIFAIIQFFWRFFEFASFFLALAGGLYLSIIIKENKKRYPIFIGLFFALIIMMLIINSTAHKQRYISEELSPNLLIQIDKEIKKGNINYQFASYEAEYFPLGLSVNIIQDRKPDIEPQDHNTEIKNVEKDKFTLSFDIQINNKETLELPFVYYKGYNAYLNDKQIDIKKSKNGFVEIQINEPGKVYVEFTGTPIQRYSLHITLVSILLLCIYIYWYNRKNKKNK